MRAGALALALAACGSAAADPSPRARTDAVRLHMRESFSMLHDIERALVHGKLDSARELAHAIARAPDEPGMLAFAIDAARVRERAAAVARAPTVDDALRAETRLAEACATCHAATSAHLELAVPPPPPDRPTITARMARHLWASDRLWEGVLADRDDAWRAGLDVLAADPLPASELGDRAPYARRLQHLASDARRTRHADGATRASQYGEILVACAACHAKRADDVASR